MLSQVLQYKICFVTRASYQLQHELQLKFNDIMWVRIKLVLSRLRNSHTHVFISSLQPLRLYWIGLIRVPRKQTSASCVQASFKNRASTSSRVPGCVGCIAGYRARKWCLSETHQLRRSTSFATHLHPCLQYLYLQFSSIQIKGKIMLIRCKRCSHKRSPSGVGF
jgi:hypothetical protein